MKFCVENDLSIFEFHDSDFSFSSYDGRDLVISAAMVNVHKNTPQNPSEYDMQIASAQITFKNFHSATYAPGSAWETDGDGKAHPVGPHTIYRGQDGINKILEALKNKISVYHFEKEGCAWSIGGCGIDPYFTIEFESDGVIVCWDEYKKKAWYELHRQYRYDSQLRTPKGVEHVQIHVSCHEETVYCQGVRMAPPVVIVGCRYDGTQYWGYGSDHFWIDAFANLQRQLPEGVLLTCCLTCRYGNLCPVSNDLNEVLCTKDALVTQKSDLHFYTGDDTERAKRTRPYCGMCEDYQPQTDDSYTYNNDSDFPKKG